MPPVYKTVCSRRIVGGGNCFTLGLFVSIVLFYFVVLVPRRSFYVAAATRLCFQQCLLLGFAPINDLTNMYVYKYFSALRPYRLLLHAADCS